MLRLSKIKSGMAAERAPTATGIAYASGDGASSATEPYHQLHIGMRELHGWT